jgi:acyl-CoA hydrolase
MTIKPAKSYVDVTNDNYYLLGILDAIKDFNRISDRDNKSVIVILTNKIRALSAEKTTELIEYALKYPPRVRALLGAIMEYTGKVVELDPIKKSLNPLSTYKYGIENGVLTNLSKWYLK